MKEQRLEGIAKDLFGEIRDATPEESASVGNYIQSISVPLCEVSQEVAEHFPEQVAKVREPKIEEIYATCCYCGKILSLNDVIGMPNNAEDYGLHPGTAGKTCCPRCNRVITVTNRYLSHWLQTGQTLDLEQAAKELLDFVKEEKQR